jgi:type I restriction enzyme S subunit
MKAGLAALGEVSEFIRGITFTPNDVEEVASTNTVGVMRTKNVQEQLDLNDVWQIDRKFVKNKNQYLEEGDLLVSSANSWNLVGKASWVPFLNYESSFGGFVTVLRGNKKLVDRRYLYYWFVSDRIQKLLRSFSNKTTNISNLSLSRAKELTIPLPPLAEQQRIAALLDTADRILKQRELAIAKLDQLAQSVFVDIFKSEKDIKKLSDLFLINMNRDAGINITNNSDLLNSRDELLGNLNQFTYLLTFK